MEIPAIRRMRADEADAVAALLVEANEEHLAAFPPDVASAYRAELVDVAGRAAGAEVHVAELAGRVVGSVTFVPDAADDAHPWPPGGSVLRFLAVAPDVRGSGTAKRLTVACIERARTCGARFLGLHTAPVMVAARHIYEHLGFERAPKHDFSPGSHYGGTADADEVPWGLAYLLHLD